MRRSGFQPLHDLCLKYSSCFFASFPLGHFIIDNICHRMAAAALFDVKTEENLVICFEKTSVNWSFSKTLTSDAHTISSHKWWLNIFQQNFVHQYIVSRTKLSLYHETEEEVEGISKPAGRTNVKSLFFCLIQNWMKNKFLITIGPAFLPPSPITPVKWQSPVGEPHFSKMMMTMTHDGHLGQYGSW